MSTSSNRRVTRGSKASSSTSNAAAASPPSRVSSFTVARRGRRSSTAVGTRLALPVELVTDIFKLALPEPTSRSSPYKSSASPYKEYVSLLAASRTFRAIAIPIIYQSIIITKPKDFLIFFGVGRGVFVVGYDLEQKRAVLKEICLANRACFPLSLSGLAAHLRSQYRVDGLEDEDPLLCFSDLSVESVTILSLRKKRAVAVLAAEQAELDRLIHLCERDRQLRAQLAEEEDDDPSFVARRARKVATKTVITRWAQMSFPSAQVYALCTFLRCVQPPTIRLSRTYPSFLGGLGTEVITDPVRFVLYRPTKAQAASREPKNAIAVTKSCLAQTFVNCQVEKSELDRMRIR